ncbi:MAG: glycosyl hydrolase family 28-related protein, partial [Candidatus Latescibacteria bacterium]|nr:glycosyl hydrolase family 28-related protein [Candidatus Latescibacterota bacterium]
MSQNGVQCSGWQMSLISMLLSGGIMLFFAVGLSVEDADAQSYSELWGKNGEQWHSKSRLPDFSRAGYHNGELEIPEVVVRANVKDFGAVGDGVADDTRAFKEAIAATDEGAIEIPPGRYVLAEPLHIKKRGIVLRGAGPDHTILVIPKSLQQLLPADQFTALGVPKLKYSFGGAFI